MRFEIYEIQEVSRNEIWVHTVEADSLEEAIEAAQNGEDCDYGPITCGTLGDDGYGLSGWGASLDEASKDYEAQFIGPQIGGSE